MTRRAVVALGIGQCVNWGVLYYTFAVLVVPLKRELGVETWVVTGAFSLALLMSAVIAPAVGRLSDRDRGAFVMQAGGFMGAVFLVAWALFPSLLTLYLTWFGLGLCMAASLYEPAFIIIGRMHRDPVARLRALALVTLIGGLASSIFLPVTAISVREIGWRPTVVAIAVLLAASTCAIHIYVFRHQAGVPSGPPLEDAHLPAASGGIDRPRFWFLAIIFGVTSLASTAFTANIVPALGERGISPATAATLGGLNGVMQLPGRALLLTGAFAGSPGRLISICLTLQAIGLGVLALTQSTLASAVGIMLLMAGAGLLTLVRPHLVLRTFGAGETGYLNGLLVRGQQLGRAVGPISVALLASTIGYGSAFMLLGAVFVFLTLGSYRLLSD